MEDAEVKEPQADTAETDAASERKFRSVVASHILSLEYRVTQHQSVLTLLLGAELIMAALYLLYVMRRGD